MGSPIRLPGPLVAPLQDDLGRPDLPVVWPCIVNAHNGFDLTPRKNRPTNIAAANIRAAPLKVWDRESEASSGQMG